MVRINRKINCCGCTACANVCPVHCIMMTEDEEEFLYPEVQELNCIKCGRCNEVCPVSNYKETEKDLELCFTAYNKSDVTRGISASGRIIKGWTLRGYAKNIAFL